MDLDVFSYAPGTSDENTVAEGTLSCDSCSRVFPIEDEVPRLYLNAFSEHQDFRRKHGLGVPEEAHIQSDSAATNAVKKT